ncbi:hypothetical protein DFJ74DRAFT_671522 [Hyaloraphidium curvatum]|nr:hypothetical protein DFJ74DRAFT_671522 [Hyaloraphidium curvatum]
MASTMPPPPPAAGSTGSVAPPGYKPTPAEEKAIKAAKSLNSYKTDMILISGFVGTQLGRYLALRLPPNAPAAAGTGLAVVGFAGGAAAGMQLFGAFQRWSLMRELPPDSELRRMILERNMGRTPRGLPAGQGPVPMAPPPAPSSPFPADTTFDPAPQYSPPARPFDEAPPGNPVSRQPDYSFRPVADPFYIPPPAPSPIATAPPPSTSDSADAEVDPYDLPAPQGTTSWAEIRRRAGAQPSAWERVRREAAARRGGEQEVQGTTMVPSRPMEETGMVEGGAGLFARTREEREEMERRGLLKRNEWGDPI